MKLMNGINSIQSCQLIAVALISFFALQACAPHGPASSSFDRDISTNLVGDSKKSEARRILAENRDWVLSEGTLAGVGSEKCFAISNGKSTSGAIASIEVILPKSSAEVSMIYVGLSDANVARLTGEVKGSRLKLRGLKVYSGASGARYWLIGSDPLSIKTALTKGSALTLRSTSESGATDTYVVSLLGSTAILNNAHPDCIYGDRGKQLESEFFDPRAPGGLFLAKVENLPAAHESSQQVVLKLIDKLNSIFRVFVVQSRAKSEFRQALAEGFERALSEARLDGGGSAGHRTILTAAEKIHRRLAENSSLQESIRADLRVLQPQAAAATSAAQAQEKELAKITVSHRPMFEKNNAMIKELSEGQAKQKLAEAEKAQADRLLKGAQDELSKLRVNADTTARRIEKTIKEGNAAATKLNELEGTLASFDLATEEERIRNSVLPSLERKLTTAREQISIAQKEAAKSAKDLAQAEAALSRCNESSASECKTSKESVEAIRATNLERQARSAVAKANFASAESALRQSASAAKSEALKSKRNLETNVNKARALVDRLGSQLSASNAELENLRSVLLPAKEKTVEAHNQAAESARISLLRRSEDVLAKSAAVAAFRSANQFQEAQGAIEEQIERLAAARTDVERISREVVRRKQQLDTHIIERESFLAEYDELISRARALDSQDAPALLKLLRSVESADVKLQRTKQTTDTEILVLLGEAGEIVGGI